MKSSLGNESIHGKFPVNDIKDYNAWVHDVKTNPGNGL